LGSILLALLAATTFPSALRAQSSPRHKESRYLLIFDTSSAMKKRLPEEEKGIKRLFALTFSSQLHEGDTIGVWTFDENVRTGEFPLQYWRGEDINLISSNIITFVEKHRYAKSTSYQKLIPKLYEVMNDSPRLVTLIFCDGETPIKGTPVDSSINEVFKKNEALMRKDREPYVLVFRTQSGNYVTSTINTAASINVPMPPAPPPPARSPMYLPPSAPLPESTAPPLIIIGRAVGTNLPPPALVPSPAPPPEQTPPPAPAPVTATNEAPANSSSLIIVMPPPKRAVPTNSVPEATSETNAIPAAEAAPTNVTPPPEVMSPPPAAPATTTQAPETPVSRGILIAIAGGVIVIAGVGVYAISRRSRRRSSTSLITESLKKK
jgi:hypothetical protein